MKLIKTEDEQGVMYSLSGDNLPENYKLSKQNCEDLFGVVYVRSLGIEHSKEIVRNTYGGMVMQEWEEESVRDFSAGFNKAMELNKDKVFTREDMRTAYDNGMWNIDRDGDYIDRPDDDFLDTINRIQQPTEIDVVVVMEHYKDSDFRDDGKTYAIEIKERPKLDSEGNLILKKI